LQLFAKTFTALVSHRLHQPTPHPRHTLSPTEHYCAAARCCLTHTDCLSPWCASPSRQTVHPYCSRHGCLLQQHLNSSEFQSASATAVFGGWRVHLAVRSVDIPPSSAKACTPATPEYTHTRLCNISTLRPLTAVSSSSGCSCCCSACCSACCCASATALLCLCLSSSAASRAWFVS
jgi:hypothetical protein